MTTYQVGNTITWGLLVTDANGAAADTGVMPTVQVTLPDATTASASVSKVSTGNYKAEYASAQAGRLRALWSASGVNSGGFPYGDVADVWAADPRLIISLSDARAALNTPSGVYVSDDELRFFIASATPVIEDLVGPMLVKTEVEVRSGSRSRGLNLWNYPTEVSQVKEDGVVLASTAWCWDEAGILWRGTYPGAMRWSGKAPRNIEVTYTCGQQVIPPNVLNAAREEVRFLWQIGQQGVRPVLDSGTGTTPSGFAVPNRVIELCGPSMSNQTPGIG